MYYVLSNDFDNYNGVVEYDIPKVWMKYPNYTTNRIEEELPSIIFYINKKEPLPDFLVNTESYLLFNDYLRKVIDKYSNNSIQYFRTYVKDRKTKVDVGNYYLARVLVEINCINLKKSNIEYYDDNLISNINSLSLDEDKIGNHSIFILGEAPFVIVREDLVEAIKQSKCTGMKFIRPEDFNM